MTCATMALLSFPPAQMYIFILTNLMGMPRWGTVCETNGDQKPDKWSSILEQCIFTPSKHYIIILRQLEKTKHINALETFLFSTADRTSLHSNYWLQSFSFDFSLLWFSLTRTLFHYWNLRMRKPFLPTAWVLSALKAGAELLTQNKNYIAQ